MFRVLLSLLLLPWLALAAPETPHTAQTEHYTIEWAPGLDNFAMGLVDAAEKHHARIYGELGATAKGRTTVALLPDEASMLAAAQARFGHRPPEWADGLAYPSARAIFLHPGKGPGPLDVTFQHEISHVALGAIAERRNVPRWFSEGLAIRQSEGFAWERAWLLTEAATMGALMDLDRLERGFPPGSARAGVAYAQSVHFVGYLEAEFGTPKFRELIERLRSGERFQNAVMAAFGVPLETIEAQWRSSLQLWWGWLPVIFGSTTLWVFGAVVLVLAWRRRKRQHRAQLEQMRAREAIEMADDIEIAHDLRPPTDLHDPYDGRPPTIH